MTYDEFKVRLHQALSYRLESMGVDNPVDLKYVVVNVLLARSPAPRRDLRVRIEGPDYEAVLKAAEALANGWGPS